MTKIEPSSLADAALLVAESGYTHVVMLPCSILTEWFGAQPEFGVPQICVTREEEGVGLSAGLLAAGAQPLLMMQNSGLGNSVNAFASLVRAYAIPLVTLVSLRGDNLDENPAQGPMGRATTGVIEALGFAGVRVQSQSALGAALVDARSRAEEMQSASFILLPRKAALC